MSEKEKHIIELLRKERRSIHDELDANDENPSYNKRKAFAYIAIFTHFLYYVNKEDEMKAVELGMCESSRADYKRLKTNVERAYYIVARNYVAPTCNKWREQALEFVKAIIEGNIEKEVIIIL